LTYLVRHGQTEFNLARRLQGQCDSPLTELGVEQVRRMGAHLKAAIGDHDRVRIIASPLGRTVRTAEIIRETIGIDVEIALDARIQEVHLGDWEQFGHAEIEAAAPGAMGQPGWLLRTPGGESFDDVAGRMTSFLAEIDESDGLCRIVVSHGIAGRILRGLYAGEPTEAIWTSPAPPQDAVFHLSGGRVTRIDDSHGW
jgi:probable phosphoglycerate mutase